MIGLGILGLDTDFDRGSPAMSVVSWVVLPMSMPVHCASSVFSGSSVVSSKDTRVWGFRRGPTERFRESRVKVAAAVRPCFSVVISHLPSLLSLVSMFFFCDLLFVAGRE